MALGRRRCRCGWPARCTRCVGTGRTRLAAVYPPHEATDDDALGGGRRRPSTPSRGAASALARQPAADERGPPERRASRGRALDRGAAPLPFVLSELGASAGLNLSFDRFALTAGGAAPWRRGQPRAPCARVAGRRACRRARPRGRPRGRRPQPARPRATPRTRLRLLAYLWPDQPDRLRLTEAAIALAEARPDRGRRGRLAGRAAGRAVARAGCTWSIHTIAWQYFPPDDAGRGAAALAEAGARATRRRAAGAGGMEADGDGRGRRADRAACGPGARPALLARVDFHGRWIEWRA